MGLREPAGWGAVGVESEAGSTTPWVSKVPLPPKYLLSPYCMLCAVPGTGSIVSGTGSPLPSESWHSVRKQ